MKRVTGHTAKTKQNYALNAGVLFKNFSFGTDTYDSAMSAGKCLGDTKGGNTFKAVPQFFSIETDGSPENTVGNTYIDFWEVTLNCNLSETTAETIKLALASCTATAVSDKGYTKIVGKKDVDDSDYIENITMITTITGSNDPIIIQVFNAYNKEGLEFKTEKKNAAVTSITFTGNYTNSNDEEPPFAIYLPNIE